MLFNSLQFAIFLPVVFVIYWALPYKYRWPVLLVASYYFYMSWNVKYVVLILFTTAASFLSAICIEKIDSAKKKKVILWMTLITCLGVLFVFKYFNFFTESFSQIARFIGIRLHPITLKLLLPVGISFYTFQTLSYVIDVYRGDIKAERSFGIYATFVSFFPQLVAGPIERTRNLIPQIKAEHTFNYNQATNGLKLMAWGFFKKIVIADTISPYVDRVFDNVASYHGFALILATFFFSIQIYCDFSGYSDIARGTAKLMGIELMDNFKSPYLSASIHEFWKRWHISLSTWFRDYIYIPMGGNRVRKVRQYCNVLLTFLISGLWHGANWTFVIWGGVHGVAQIAEQATGLRNQKNSSKAIWIIRVIIVFLFTMFAWVFFRVQRIEDALYLFRHMLDGISKPLAYFSLGFSTRKNIGIGLSKGNMIKILGCIMLLLSYDYAALRTDVIDWLSNQRACFRHAFYFCLILIIAIFHAIGEVSFVYFQF